MQSLSEYGQSMFKTGSRLHVEREPCLSTVSLLGLTRGVRVSDARLPSHSCDSFA